MFAIDFTKPEPAQLLAAQIRATRRGYGLNQEELAIECGIYIGRLRDYENGHREVPFADLVRIAQALQTPLSSFEKCLTGERSLF
jgi:transcriptional regulator with XRE-family HTH domain